MRIVVVLSSDSESEYNSGSEYESSESEYESSESECSESESASD